MLVKEILIESQCATLFMRKIAEFQCYLYILRHKAWALLDNLVDLDDIHFKLKNISMLTGIVYKLSIYQLP